MRTHILVAGASALLLSLGEIEARVFGAEVPQGTIDAVAGNPRVWDDSAGVVGAPWAAVPPCLA